MLNKNVIPLLAPPLERYPQVVRWTRASGTTCGKGEVPSLAKEGWPRHQVNGPVPLKARPGWFVQLPIIGGLNQPPRSCELIVIRRYSPPCTTARRGGCVIKENLAKPPKQTQPGWFSFLDSSENHPGLAISGCFAIFSESLGHPSVQ